METYNVHFDNKDLIVRAKNIDGLRMRLINDLFAHDTRLRTVIVSKNDRILGNLYLAIGDRYVWEPYKGNVTYLINRNGSIHTPREVY